MTYLICEQHTAIGGGVCYLSAFQIDFWSLECLVFTGGIDTWTWWYPYNCEDGKVLFVLAGGRQKNEQSTGLAKNGVRIDKQRQWSNPNPMNGCGVRARVENGGLCVSLVAPDSSY